MKNFLTIIFFILGLSSCHKQDNNTLVIGTIAGPETELVETAQQVAAKDYNLNVKIVEFSDYNLPNEALNDGSLDANIYQHLPYLKQAIKARGYNIIPIGKTFIYPTGIYSKRFQKLSELPEHAIIAIPNDPSNENRALLLLQKAGLIKLKGKGDALSVNDISRNTKKLVFKELDAAQLPRSLDDVDAAVINTNFAVPAGLSPSRDALFVEGKDSPYANIIVAKKDSKKMPQLKLFVKAMNSPSVAEKAKQIFGDDAVPAW
ncbi:MetQ/NlpA family ABC transporter substrate-binding protein [Legionella sp. W05-934-2]|jgi:D-methionine transport system substrate-binding protein|uniref:MetQ/NlpA family ABC transporter substrate-binding protein n=1 Tax=Legionella sp. W05-934-2 TaxID=1198649 RepID=UPI00346201F7